MIPDDIIQEIKRRTSISAVIGRTVKLKRAGRNWVGLCPFHNEKTPSFNVRDDEGFYKCFGCDAKGDVFKFLQDTSGQDFYHVVRQLADEAGLELPEEDIDPQKAERARQRKRMLRVLELAQLYFRGRLRADEGKPARAYLRDVRGIHDDEIESFSLGYGGASDTGLRDFLEREGISPEEAVEAGVLAEGRNGAYNFFRQRITFPVRNVKGEVLSFSARIFGPNEKGRPKYVNGPATRVYDKSRALYGLYEALPALKKGAPAVLVEGQLDVIATHRAGLRSGLAVSGTALTDRHVEEVLRRTERVVIALDADAAGKAAAERAVLHFTQAGADVALATLLEKDPDAMVRNGDAESLGRTLQGAPPAIEVLIQNAVEGAVGSLHARARAVDHLLPFLAAHPRELRRSQYSRRAAQALHEDADLLWKEVERRGRDLLRKRISMAPETPAPRARPTAAGAPPAAQAAGPRAPRTAAARAAPRSASRPLVKWTDAERSLALALLTHPLLAPRCGVLVESLRNAELRGFVERLSEALVRFHDLDPAEVLRRVAMPRQSVLFELVRKVLEAGAFEEPSRLLSEQAATSIIDDFVRKYDERSLEEQLAEVQRAMAALPEQEAHAQWRELELQQRALIVSLRETQAAKSAGQANARALPAPSPSTPQMLLEAPPQAPAAQAEPAVIPGHEIDSDLPPDDGAWEEAEADWETM